MCGGKMMTIKIMPMPDAWCHDTKALTIRIHDHRTPKRTVDTYSSTWYDTACSMHWWLAIGDGRAPSFATRVSWVRVWEHLYDHLLSLEREMKQLHNMAVAEVVHNCQWYGDADMRVVFTSTNNYDDDDALWYLPLPTAKARSNNNLNSNFVKYPLTTIALNHSRICRLHDDRESGEAIRI